MNFSFRPGKLISKVGADGVWLCGVLPSDKWPTGLGIALKIEDGDDMRARPVVAIDVLRKLSLLSGSDLPELSPMPLRNRKGDTVGVVRSAIEKYPPKSPGRLYKSKLDSNQL